MFFLVIIAAVTAQTGVHEGRYYGAEHHGGNEVKNFGGWKPHDIDLWIGSFLTLFYFYEITWHVNHVG